MNEGGKLGTVPIRGQSPKATPLLAQHQQEGAKLVPFAGWQMPLEYSGILAEHRAVREDKGLFDLSHMGEIEVSGSGASSYLQNLVAGNLSSLRQGQALYTVMCKEDGGILDDLVVYFLGEKFLLVVNASNTEKIFRWMEDHQGSQVTLRDRTDEMALLAVQGPQSQTFLQPLCGSDLSRLLYYHSFESKIGPIPAMISRTGYTGEDGFEIYVEASQAAKVWQALREKGIRSIGLGARDTLRLEAGYPLYGNDMDETTSPLEVGLSWVVKLDKGFIGKESLVKQKTNGIPRRQIAFTMMDRSVPRKDYPIVSGGSQVGVCTSGTFSPSLSKGIGLALVETPKTGDSFSAGKQVSVLIRGKEHPAVVCKKPFVQGSVKRGS